MAIDIELPTGGRFGAIRYRTVGDFFSAFFAGKYILMHLHSIDINQADRRDGVQYITWDLEFSGGTTHRPLDNFRRYKLRLELPAAMYEAIWYLASYSWIRENPKISITIRGSDVKGLLCGIVAVRNWRQYNRWKGVIRHIAVNELPRYWAKYGRWDFGAA